MPFLEHVRGTDAAELSQALIPRVPETLAKWFAIRVRAQREFRVRDDLTRLEMEVFLPTWSEEVRWSDRTKTVTRVFFPGYVFARFAGALAFFTALSTRGVVQILPNSHTPLAITDSEIENVRRMMAAGVPAAPCEYVAGELVTIDSGPLAGVAGVVVRTRGSLRVVVSVEILRRSISVELDAGTLVKRTED